MASCGLGNTAAILKGYTDEHMVHMTRTWACRKVMFYDGDVWNILLIPIWQIIFALNVLLRTKSVCVYY